MNLTLKSIKNLHIFMACHHQQILFPLILLILIGLNRVARCAPVFFQHLGSQWAFPTLPPTPFTFQDDCVTPVLAPKTPFEWILSSSFSMCILVLKSLQATTCCGFSTNKLMNIVLLAGTITSHQFLRNQSTEQNEDSTQEPRLDLKSINQPINQINQSSLGGINVTKKNNKIQSSQGRYQTKS